MSEVVCVKVKDIRPKYKNLKEWIDDENNVYIGRRGIVFIMNEDGDKERYPKKDSIWANPFKVSKDLSRDECIDKYKEYIMYKIKNDPIKYDLKKLIGKTLGCWCKPEACHGDVLKELCEKL